MEATDFCLITLSIAYNDIFKHMSQMFQEALST